MAKYVKLLGGITLISLLVLVVSFAAIAATDKNEDDTINGVTLTVEADVSEEGGGDLRVTASSEKYNVSSYDFESASGSWKPGEIPRVNVILDAEEGYVFSRKIGTGTIKVKGGTCSKIKRTNDGKNLEVTIRLKAVKGDMGDIENAYWVENPIGKAKWEEAENANAYELRLYRGSTMLKKVDKVSTTTYDFYPYMTKEGRYTFWVRAIPKNSDEADYLDAGEWQVSNNFELKKNEVAPAGLSQNESTGNSVPGESYAGHQRGWMVDNKGWWYQRDDGTYPSNNWENINNKWFLFDMAGYMMTGWQQRNDKFYYLTSNGEMVTGWLEHNRQWYYLGNDGSMITGLQDIGGRKFYFNGNGSMATGWLKLAGSKWYYFNPADGAALTNTEVDGRRLNAEGYWTS